METINIVNQDLQFRKVSLVEPTGHFYLHIATEVDKSFLPFFLTTSLKKKKLIDQCKQFCRKILKENNIVSAVVFKAQLIPPGQGKFIEQRKEIVHIAKFDVAVLIEATTLEAINDIKNSDAFKLLNTAVQKASTFSHIITATNVKYINSVDHNKQGVFLFNYFFGDSLQQNLGVWEYTAGWFQQETGLDNSTVLLHSIASDRPTTIQIYHH